VFVCYPAAFCQLCFYNKDWIGSVINCRYLQMRIKCEKRLAIVFPTAAAALLLCSLTFLSLQESTNSCV